MARSIVGIMDELKQFVEEQTQGIGSVANLHGVIETADAEETVKRPQNWFVGTVSADSLPDLTSLFASFTYERPGYESLDSDDTGYVQYPASGASIPAGKAVFFMGTARTPSARTLTLRVRGEAASLAVYIDGVQVASGPDTLRIEPSLSQGDHVVVVIAHGVTKPVTVESSRDVEIVRSDVPVTAPTWAAAPTAYVLEPQSGTVLSRLAWANGAQATSWNLYRNAPALLGTVAASPAPAFNADGQMVLTLPGSVALPEGAILYTEYFEAGTVVSAVTTTNTVVTITPSLDSEATASLWSDLRMYRVGMFEPLASVSNSGGDIITYDDLTVRRGALYLYQLTALGPFGLIESAYSTARWLWTSDDTPPASILSPAPKTEGFDVVVRFTTPSDPDYAGVRVYGPYALDGLGNIAPPAAFSPSQMVLSHPGVPGTTDQVSFRAAEDQPDSAYFLATYDHLGNEQRPQSWTNRRTGAAQPAAYGLKWDGPSDASYGASTAMKLDVDLSDARNTATQTVVKLLAFPADAVMSAWVDGVKLTGATQTVNGRAYPALTLVSTGAESALYEVILARQEGRTVNLIATAETPTGGNLRPFTATYTLDEDTFPGLSGVHVENRVPRPTIWATMDDDAQWVRLVRVSSGATLFTATKTAGTDTASVDYATATLKWTAGVDLAVDEKIEHRLDVSKDGTNWKTGVWFGSIQGLAPIGPKLTVTPTPGNESYSIAWSGSGTVTLSIDGGAYGTPPASPIVVTRQAYDRQYSFRAVADGQEITNAVTVPTSAILGAPGRQMLSNPEFSNGQAKWHVYDNNGTGRVTHAIVTDAAAPNATGKLLRVTTADGVTATSPGLGGFYAGITVDGGTAEPDKYHRGAVIVWRVRAKIPTGYRITWGSNGTGDGGTFAWRNSQEGTGAFVEYIGEQRIGTTNATEPFGNTGFWYITPLNGQTNVSWDVAKVTALDVNMAEIRPVATPDLTVNPDAANTNSTQVAYTASAVITQDGSAVTPAVQFVGCSGTVNGVAVASGATANVTGTVIAQRPDSGMSPGTLVFKASIAGGGTETIQRTVPAREAVAIKLDVVVAEPHHDITLTVSPADATVEATVNGGGVTLTVSGATRKCRVTRSEAGDQRFVATASKAGQAPNTVSYTIDRDDEPGANVSLVNRVTTNKVMLTADDDAKWVRVERFDGTNWIAMTTAGANGTLVAGGTGNHNVSVTKTLEVSYGPLAVDATVDVRVQASKQETTGYRVAWTGRMQGPPPDTNTVGPNLTVTPTPGPDSYSLAWSGDNVQVSIDGATYAAPAASPITVNRPAPLSAGVVYTFRGTRDGVVTTNSITIPPKDSDTVTPDLVVTQKPTPTAQKETHLVFSASATNPQTGAAITPTVDFVGCSATVNGVAFTEGSAPTNAVGDIVVARPAFGSPSGTVIFLATVAGGGQEAIQRTIPAQETLAPTLDVVPTITDSKYDFVWSSAVGNEIAVSLNGGNYIGLSGTGGTHSVERPRPGEPAKTVSFRARRSSIDTINSFEVPAYNNRVNNVAVTGTTTKWGLHGNPALTVVDRTFGATLTKSHQLRSDGNSHNVAEMFSIDKSKAYKFTIHLASSATTGAAYFGLYARNAAGSLVNVTPVTRNAGVVGTANSNPYFWETSGTGLQPLVDGWVRFVGFLVPEGTDPNLLIGAGEGVHRHYIMASDISFVQMRYLNWSNTTTAIKDVWATHISVEEIPVEAIHNTITPDLYLETTLTNATTIRFKPTASNPIGSKGLSPIISVSYVGCTTNVANPSTVGSGSIVEVTRPDFGAGSGTISFEASLPGGGKEVIQRTIPAKERDTAAPLLSVKETAGATAYTYAAVATDPVSPARGTPSIVYRIDGGTETAYTAAVSAGRGATPAAGKTIEFKAKLAGAPDSEWQGYSIPGIPPDTNTSPPNIKFEVVPQTNSLLANVLHTLTVTAVNPNGGTVALYLKKGTNNESLEASGATPVTHTFTTTRSLRSDDKVIVARAVANDMATTQTYVIDYDSEPELSTCAVYPRYEGDTLMGWKVFGTADDDTKSVECAVGGGLRLASPLVNGDGQMGDARGWISGTTNTLTMDSTTKYRGMYSFKMDHATAVDEIRYQDISITAGQIVRVEGYVKTTALPAADAGVFAGLRPWAHNGATFTLLAYDAPFISGNTSTSDIRIGLPADGVARDWTRVWMLLRITASGSLRTHMQFGFGGQTGTAWFDDIRVVYPVINTDTNKSFSFDLNQTYGESGAVNVTPYPLIDKGNPEKKGPVFAQRLDMAPVTSATIREVSATKVEVLLNSNPRSSAATETANPKIVTLWRHYVRGTTPPSYTSYWQAQSKEIDRHPTEDTIIEYYTRVGEGRQAVSESPKQTIIDSDTLPEIKDFAVTKGTNRVNLSGKPDDDTSVWRVWARKGQWPTHSGGTTATNPTDLNDDFLRFQGTPKDNLSGFSASAGTWYVVARAYDWAGVANPTVQKGSVSIDGAAVAEISNLALVKVDGTTDYHEIAWNNNSVIEAGTHTVTIKKDGVTLVSGRDAKWEHGGTNSVANSGSYRDQTEFATQSTGELKSHTFTVELYSGTTLLQTANVAITDYYPKPTTVAGAPTVTVSGLTATAVDNTTFDLSWTNDAGASTAWLADIYRAIGTGEYALYASPFVNGAGTAQTMRAQDDTAGTHTFYIKYRNDSGSGPASAEASVYLKGSGTDDTSLQTA